MTDFFFVKQRKLHMLSKPDTLRHFLLQRYLPTASKGVPALLRSLPTLIVIWLQRIASIHPDGPGCCGCCSGYPYPKRA